MHPQNKLGDVINKEGRSSSSEDEEEEEISSSSEDEEEEEISSSSEDEEEEEIEGNIFCQAKGIELLHGKSGIILPKLGR